MHTTLKNIFSRAAQQPLNSRTPALSKRQRPLFAEQLEARRLLAADATVNLTGASQSLLGEDVNFVVTFDIHRLIRLTILATRHLLTSLCPSQEMHRHYRIMVFHFLLDQVQATTA
ncbi:MAG: hypothetical protein HOK57_09030 [Planctomycetaceae bacterium]|nr:hypothetical protein [Planctomycetaceae bacterium]